MSDYDFIKMQKKLAKYLDENRYEHTLGVMFTCASLAMVHGYDLKDAQVAGLLHEVPGPGIDGENFGQVRRQGGANGEFDAHFASASRSRTIW